MQVVCVNLTQADYDGYQLALWREIAADMGLKEGTDWSFQCMDWDVMIDDLVDENGNCTLAAAGTWAPLKGLEFESVSSNHAGRNCSQ